MKWQQLRYVAVILTMSLTVKCAPLGGSEVGNPGLGSNNLKIVGIERSVGTPKLLANGLEILTAQIAVSRIRFRPISYCESDIDEDNVEYRGPFVTDLLANTTLPSLEDMEIPLGTYCRIELRLDKLDNDEIPSGIAGNAAIVGNSLHITGQRQDGKPFTIKLEVNDDFRLENSSSGFVVSAVDVQSYFFIAFDMAIWFSGIDLDSAVVSSGEILIDKDNNQTILDQFITNFKISADLFKDSNDDGSLDDAEDESDDELAHGEDV